MRYEPNPHPDSECFHGTLYLSERNLLSLLAKLYIPGSSRTLINNGIAVISEHDADHYHPQHKRFAPGSVGRGTEITMNRIKQAFDQCLAEQRSIPDSEKPIDEASV